MKQPTNKIQASIPEGAAPQVAEAEQTLASTGIEAFGKAIESVCAMYGYNLVAQPVFKPAFDGSFTVSAQITAVPRQK